MVTSHTSGTSIITIITTRSIIFGDSRSTVSSYGLTSKGDRTTLAIYTSTHLLGCRIRNSNTTMRDLI